MLKMFKLPSLTRLRLHRFSENSSTDSDLLLLPVVAAYLQCPAHIEFKSLCVTINHRSRLLHVAASTAPPSWGSLRSKDFKVDADGNSEFVLSFDRLPVFGSWTDLSEGVLQMSLISNLDFLSISTFDARDDPIYTP
jgi:hypothetical protein